MMNSKIISRTQAEEKLILDVIARQSEEGLGERAFAKKLGIPFSTWQAIKTCRRHINNTLITAIIKVYGGKFDDQIMAFHREGCPTAK